MNGLDKADAWMPHVAISDDKIMHMKNRIIIIKKLLLTIKI